MGFWSLGVEVTWFERIWGLKTLSSGELGFLDTFEKPGGIRSRAPAFGTEVSSRQVRRSKFVMLE